MTAAEIVGPAAHDGMRLDLPPHVLAVAIITEGPNGYEASLSERRGAAIDREALAGAVLDLALNIPEGSQP